MKMVVLALSIYLSGFVAPVIADNLRAKDTSTLAAQKKGAYETWNAALESGSQVTPKLVHDNFATVIETNLSSPDAEAIISRLSERELADIARLHTVAPLRSKGFEADVRTRIGKIQQARLAAAFSKANQSLNPAGVVTSAGVVTNATPTVDMALYEIYLEFRTAPVGSLSVSGSLYETAAFAGTRLAGSFGTGYAIGSALAPVIETYSPGTYDAIGGTLDAAIQNVMDAGDSFSQGQYLNGLDTLFGGFQQSYGDAFGDYSGDWGFFSAYDLFMSSCDEYYHC